MKLLWLSVTAIAISGFVLWLILGDVAVDLAGVGLMFLAFWALAAGVYGVFRAIQSKGWVDHG